MSAASTMRVSADEVVRIVQWLLRARGVHSGNEDEPAAAVLWLASRFDGVLEALGEELQSGALAPGRDGMAAPRIALHEPTHLVTDANSASALLLSPVLLDWLSAAPANSVLESATLCSPTWLLPYLAMRPGLAPVCIDVRDLDADGAPAMLLWREEGGKTRLNLFRPWDTLWRLRVWVRMASSLPEPGRDPRVIEQLDVSALEARAERVLAHGLQVESRLWQALSEATAEAMVPESSASRARGAGGGDDNR